MRREMNVIKPHEAYNDIIIKNNNLIKKTLEIDEIDEKHNRRIELIDSLVEGEISLIESLKNSILWKKT
jgi:hypothetical protein